MKKLGYIGFSGKNCVCEYLVKELNSEFILVIKQTSSSTTSIYQYD